MAPRGSFPAWVRSIRSSRAMGSRVSRALPISARPDRSVGPGIARMPMARARWAAWSTSPGRPLRALTS